MRLTGIFNYCKAILVRKVQNGIHVGHLPVEMYGHNGRDRSAAAQAQKFAGAVCTHCFSRKRSSICTDML